MFSFWEKQSFLTNDLIIIGGGIVGLSLAASVLEKNPSQKVVLLEKGVLPSGDSTKNAGLICTDSFTEFLEDIEKMGEKKSIALFFMRNLGKERLIKRLGIENMDAKFEGGYELISNENMQIRAKIKYANNMLRGLFKREVFVIRNELIDQFGFNRQYVKSIVENSLEVQIDTGKAIRSLYQYVVSRGALYLTGAEVTNYTQLNGSVEVKVKNSICKDSHLTFQAKNLVICTDAFTNSISHTPLDIVPGRGQVLITKPIKNLKIKGIFKFDEGYYYFRDYQDRIIFGGGRNLDFKGEETVQFGNNPVIINKLMDTLKEVILPNTPFEIDQEWSRIMAFSSTGKDKAPIIKKESENVYFAVRMNGMGIAYASNIGQEIAETLYPTSASL